jgi:translation initiation factor 3 subunit L
VSFMWNVHQSVATLKLLKLFRVVQEMYYRHLHALKHDDLLTLEHRKQSWENYVKLLEVFQVHDTTMKLPNIWMWDIVDEFLYQFAQYTNIKGQIDERTPGEIEFLKSNPQVWDPVKVRSILENFIEVSNIREQLAVDGGQAIYETDGFIGNSNVRRMLGYFSLVGLCRLHCLLGQHEEALKSLSPLNPFNRQYLYTSKLPMANINLYYYAGTSYLMLRRYVDAVRCFNTVLSFLFRVKDQLRCGYCRAVLSLIKKILLE